MRLERFTFSTSPSFVYNTPSVLTTSSLAPTPEISPIPNFQSNPSGLITGSMALPICPIYEFSCCAAAYRMLGYCQIQLKKNKEACANFAKAKELGDEVVDGLIQKYCK